MNLKIPAVVLRSRPSDLSDRHRSKDVCEWLPSPQGISSDSLMSHSCEDDKLAGGHLKEQEENPLRNLVREQGFDVVNDQILMRESAQVFKFSRRFFFLFYNQIKWLIFFSAHYNTVKLQDQPLDLVVK